MFVAVVGGLSIWLVDFVFRSNYDTLKIFGSESDTNGYMVNMLVINTVIVVFFAICSLVVEDIKETLYFSLAICNPIVLPILVAIIHLAIFVFACGAILGGIGYCTFLLVEYTWRFLVSTAFD